MTCIKLETIWRGRPRAQRKNCFNSAIVNESVESINCANFYELKTFLPSILFEKRKPERNAALEHRHALALDERGTWAPRSALLA